MARNAILNSLLVSPFTCGPYSPTTFLHFLASIVEKSPLLKGISTRMHSMHWLNAIVIICLLLTKSRAELLKFQNGPFLSDFTIVQWNKYKKDILNCIIYKIKKGFSFDKHGQGQSKSFVQNSFCYLYFLKINDSYWHPIYSIKNGSFLKKKHVWNIQCNICPVKMASSKDAILHWPDTKIGVKFPL